MRVNTDELKRIAKDAEAKRKAEAKARKAAAQREEEARRKTAKQRAENIIRSIPDALKKAAETAKPVKGVLVVQARIPIVRERITSSMSTRGYLVSDDALTLEAVKKQLRSVSISRVTLKVIHETHNDTFVSADGLDEATGPCVYYYLEAETFID